MKKVGVISLFGNSNYGNKLQNYAILSFIEKNFNGFNVYTIYNEKQNYLKRIIKCILRVVFNNAKYIREKNFEKFNKHLNLKKYKNIDYDNYFNFIIVGSDQVWNYNFAIFDSEIMFAKKFKNCIKLSYSASIGVSKILNSKEKIFIDGLKDFKKISVREDSANSELKRITKRDDIETLIDPTMLLTSKEWDEMSVKPTKLSNKKYILLYFLGNMSNDKMNEITKIANQMEYEIINLLDKNDPFYTCDPKEFLYLEKNASLICTDSFHSSVFAIIYNKPFVIFDRDDGLKNTSSRLDTLLSKFKLKNRKYNGKEITKENLDCDYGEANKLLEQERKKSLKFLKEILK